MILYWWVIDEELYAWVNGDTDEQLYQLTELLYEWEGYNDEVLYE